jgi:glutamate synthase (NADPH/NADH) small chain
MIVEAIGQGMDIDYMKEVELNDRRKVRVDKNYQSSIPWLFVGGDIVAGPDAISAIADGHKAAKGIDQYLNERGE